MYPPAANKQQNDLVEIQNFCVSCIRNLGNCETTSTPPQASLITLSDADLSLVTSDPTSSSALSARPSQSHQQDIDFFSQTY